MNHFDSIFDDERRHNQQIEHHIDQLPKTIDKDQRQNYIRTILHNTHIPHTPTQKQTQLLLDPTKEILFGGAAGGGKSDGILMAALQYVQNPNYRALILRRTFPELSMSDGLIPRAEEWLAPTDAKWNESKKQWKFRSGATLKFGHLEYEKHKHLYQGAAFHYIGFDELTQFTKSQYTYLHSRVRKKLVDKDIPLRIFCTSNPGGPGHEWVKSRFIIGDYKFIPSWLEDNPYLDQEEYREGLKELDPITRRQLENGDWDVRLTGGLFDRDKVKMVDIIPDGLEKTVRYWDMAATEQKVGKDPDWTVGLKMGLKNGEYCILDVIRVQQEPGDLEKTLRNSAISDGVDVSIWYEEEGGASGKIVTKHYSKTVFKGFDFKGVRSTGSKANRAKPVSAAWANGNVYLLSAHWNDDFLYEVEAFPQPEGGMHDDQVDGMSGAFTALQEGRLAYGML